MIDELYKFKKSCIGRKIISTIKNFDLLIIALKELDSLIEMDSVKSSIISQLRFLLIKQLQVRHSEDTQTYIPTSSTQGLNKTQHDQIFEGHMLHTVIYGPPGVGKTKLGCILAKIWMSLQLIPNSTKSDRDAEVVNKRSKPQITLTSEKENSIDQFDLIITKLEHKNTQWIDKMELLQQQILAQQDCYNIFYKEIKKLSDNNRFLTDRQKDLIYTTYNDCCKYLQSSSKIILEEIQQEKKDPELSIQLPINSTDMICSMLKKLKIQMQAPSNGQAPPNGQGSTTTLTPSINFNAIKVVSRADFVAEYLGQTAIKTLELLKSCLGKVLFIDEAYSLINSERDSYGMEALTVLNQFMSEHPHELVCIFAGYKDLMEKTIFDRQPGLKRRCTWIFKIDSYTSSGLSKIFESQLKEYDWSLDPSVNLNEFFSKNINSFPSFGGDTSRLAFYCKLAFANSSFSNLINIIDVNSSITEIEHKKFESSDDVLNEADLSTLSILTNPYNNPSVIKESIQTQIHPIDKHIDNTDEILSKKITIDILKSAYNLFLNNQIVEDQVSLSMYI